MSSKAELQKLVSVGELTRAQVAASSGYCTYQGCWTHVSTVKSEFLGSGYYGYGKTVLGSVHLGFTVSMSGWGSSSKPLYAYTTRGTKSTVLTGERWYLSASYPGGKGTNAGATWRTNPCGARVAYQSCQWPNTLGYQSYEPANAKITIFQEATWSDLSSAYPGKWYFYAKSIVMLNSSTGYHVSGVTLPATPALGGYSPA